MGNQKKKKVCDWLYCNIHFFVVVGPNPQHLWGMPIFWSGGSYQFLQEENTGNEHHSTFWNRELNLQAQGKLRMGCIAFVLALKEVCAVLEKTYHLTECCCCQMYPDLLQQIVTPSSPWDGLCLRHGALSLTLAFSCSRTWLGWGKKHYTIQQMGQSSEGPSNSDGRTEI